MDIVQAAVCLDPGPHAILYVVRIGRYTEEEFQTYQRLKMLFDQHISSYIFIVFTGGDQLKNEKTSTCITTYISNATGDLQTVLDECKGRYVVFNNMDTSKHKQVAVNQLLTAIQTNLSANGDEPYLCTVQDTVSQEMQKRVDSNVTQCLEGNADMEELNQKLGETKRQAGNFTRNFDRKSQRYNDLSARLKNYEKKGTMQRNEDRTQTKEMKNELKQLTSEMAELRTELKRAGNEKMEAERQRDDSQKERDALKEQIKDLEQATCEQETMKLKSKILDGSKKPWVIQVAENVQNTMRKPLTDDQKIAPVECTDQWQ